MARFKYGRKRVRTRHQDGWVEERGTKHRRWYGHYYTYEQNAEGKERRKHVGVALGDKSRMRKWEAEQKLRGIIATAASVIPRTPDQTLEWFVKERFLPMKLQNWEPSTRATNLGILSNQILPSIGKESLTAIDKFKCQVLLNTLAADEYSFSVVDHCRTMVKAIMEEAVEAELITKNPARKLGMPVTKEPVKHVLSNDDARRLFDSLPLRDRTITMIAAFCAMRPGEIFGLRWSSWRGDHFQIEGTAWRGDYRRGKAKTKGSKAPVAIPDVLQPLIERWRQDSAVLEGLMFPSTRGTPIRPENWLRRRVKPIARSLGIVVPVCFQVLRRTFATNAQTYGNPKDVQAHLRHSSITTTLGIYTQPVSASVRKLVNNVAADVIQNETIN